MIASNSSRNPSSPAQRLGIFYRLTLCLLVLSTTALAVDGARPVEQYLRRQWGVEQGLNSGRVNAVVQTPDGYLWVGTDKNLLRFDGVRFTPMQPPPDTLPPIDHVVSLSVDSGGALWIRTEDARLLRYADGSFKAVMSLQQGEPGITAVGLGQPDGLLAAGLAHGVMHMNATGFKKIRVKTNSLLIAIAQTDDDVVWLGMRESGLAFWKNGVLTPVTQGIPDGKINCLLPVKGGKLWIGTDDGLAFWDGHTATTKVLPPEMDHLRVLAMVQDRNGNLWVGTSRGLLRYNATGASWLPRGIRQRGIAITALVEDREGDLWFGDGPILERLTDSALITYGDVEDPSGEQFGPTYVDAQRRTWFAPLRGGLFWMRGGVTHQVTVGGLDKDVVYSIDGAGDDLWLGRQEGGLTRLRSKGEDFVAQTWTHKNGLAQDSVYAVRVDRHQGVWAGTLTAGVSHLVEGKITNFDRSSGLLSNTVSAIEEDHAGAIWFATPDGISVINGPRRSFTTADTLPSQDGVSLLADPGGGLWVGTASGLAFIQDAQVHTFSIPALSHVAILGMACDRHGQLWFATATSILSISRDLLINNRATPESVRQYGLSDGLHSVEGVRRARSVVADSVGQIWIATNRGLSVTSPGAAELAPSAIAHVESIISDGTPLAITSETRVPAGTRRVTFDYAGLDLRAPDEIRFRYKLDGFDKSWSDPVEIRQAVYTNLAPGKYRFHVMASNSHGRWGPDESTLAFRVDPFFWERWQFQLIAFVMLMLLFVWIYRARMHYVVAQVAMRSEERLIERTRIARELHDTLLQGFISAVLHLNLTVEQLKPDSPLLSPLQRTLRVMERVIEEARGAVKGLRTYDGASYDLEQTLRDLASELDDGEGAGYRVLVEGEVHSLRPAVYEDVCRIGREAVINAWRHAQARNILVRITYCKKGLILDVTDDGRGMDLKIVSRGKEGHWGLVGMRERAKRMGTRLQILSSPGNGTRITLNVDARVAYDDDREKRESEEATRL